MGTITAERQQEAAQKSQLVEMNWDPITRIVGSLGIFTKIDFGKRKVAECHSTSSIFRGYSIFMKGKDPRDAHLITTWCDNTPRTASWKPHPIASSGTLKSFHVLVLPACSSASACSAKYRAAAAAYAWK